MSGDHQAQPAPRPVADAETLVWRPSRLAITGTMLALVACVVICMILSIGFAVMVGWWMLIVFGAALVLVLVVGAFIVPGIATAECRIEAGRIEYRCWPIRHSIPLDRVERIYEDRERGIMIDTGDRMHELSSPVFGGRERCAAFLAYVQSHARPVPRCGNCRYSLANLPPRSACPECGLTPA